MQFVPRIPTPINAAEASAEIIRVFPGIDRLSAPLLMGLVWTETGRGNAVNHSPGNITANAKWQGEAWRPPWYDDMSTPHLEHLHDLMLQGQAPSAFRSYRNWHDGFDDFAYEIRRQFPELLEAARTGDAQQFVHALSQRYSRDYGSEHVDTFRGFQAEFGHLFQAQPEPGTSTVGGGMSGIFLAILAFYLTKGFKSFKV